LDHLTGISYYPLLFSPDQYTIGYDQWTYRRTSFPTRGHPNALSYTGFDDAGRLTSFTLNQGSSDDGSYTIAYDDAGRLATVTKNVAGTPTASFFYDQAGRLVRQVGFDGTQHGYLYDVNGRMSSVRTAAADGVESQATEYAYDAAGDL